MQRYGTVEEIAATIDRFLGQLRRHVHQRPEYSRRLRIDALGVNRSRRDVLIDE